MTCLLELERYLKEIGQEAFIPTCALLKSTQQQKLLAQLQKYPKEFLKELRRLPFVSKSPIKESIEPLEDIGAIKDPADLADGEILIKQGKVACIILAGGSGSRLGGSKPKALVSVTPVKRKSLLQLFCEKAAAASKSVKKALPIAILTSPQNHEQILSYLKKQRNFGLKEGQLQIFQQQVMPLVNDDGQFALNSRGVLAEGPDGNGGVWKPFVESGIWQKWRRKGVELVQVVFIDNPLANPFDANLFGFHSRQQAEIVVKAIPKLYEEEKVGTLVKLGGQLRILEYTEIPETIKNRKRADGTLVYSYANVGLCFSMDFIKKAAAFSNRLPLHFVRKAFEKLEKKGKRLSKQKVFLLKGEKYLFDLLEFATEAKALLYHREEVYSPLKNANGENSLETVQRSLENADQRQYFRVTGVAVEKTCFELDQAFYYPDSKLLKKWKGRSLPKRKYIKA